MAESEGQPVVGSVPALCPKADHPLLRAVAALPLFSDLAPDDVA